MIERSSIRYKTSMILLSTMFLWLGNSVSCTLNYLELVLRTYFVQKPAIIDGCTLSQSYARNLYLRRNILIIRNNWKTTKIYFSTTNTFLPFLVINLLAIRGSSVTTCSLTTSGCSVFLGFLPLFSFLKATSAKIGKVGADSSEAASSMTLGLSYDVKG